MIESARDMLRHTVATLAYRGAKAVRGALRGLGDHLASDEPVAFEPGQIFQGAIADALTHVGQINVLQRMFGHPVRKRELLPRRGHRWRAESDQATPRREFD